MKYHLLKLNIIVTFFLIALPQSVLADPLRVLWEENQREVVTAISSLGIEDVKSCTDPGLELEQRFLFKFCEKVNRLGTRCSDDLRVIHSLSFDPIQDSYRVKKDTLGDPIDPVLETYETFDDAVKALSTVSPLSLSTVAEAEPFKRFSTGEGTWNLGVRARTRCKGEYPKFLADVSYYLSFGILDFYGEDTGWEYFVLNPEGSTELPETGEAAVEEVEALP